MFKEFTHNVHAKIALLLTRIMLSCMLDWKMRVILIQGVKRGWVVSHLRLAQVWLQPEPWVDRNKTARLQASFIISGAGESLGPLASLDSAASNAYEKRPPTLNLYARP